MQKYTEADVPQHYIRLYQRKKDQWLLKGFVCPDCSAYYKGYRVELFRHESICKGKIKRSLED